MDFMEFRDGDIDAASETFLKILAQQIDLCEEDLRSNPNVPSVYRSGVVSRTLIVSKQHQIGLPYTLMTGTASPDFLACWRVAELRIKGIDAKLYLKTPRRADGGVTISVHVLIPNGKSEEPFKLCAKDQWSSVPLEEQLRRKPKGHRDIIKHSRGYWTVG